MRIRLVPSTPLKLSPGVHLLPARYSPDESQRFAELLRDLLPGVAEVRHIPWEEAVRGLPAGAVASDVLVVVAVPETAGSFEAPLAALGARYVLARVGPHVEGGFSWLERAVKPAVVSALWSAVRDPERVDPRCALDRALLRRAASLTGDPLELLLLVEGTIEGCSARREESPSHADLDETLQLVAGTRLAELLSRLPTTERTAAFTLLLSGGEGDDLDVEFRLGAHALRRLGLAAYVAGDLALGPLARAAAAPGLLQDALVNRVPPDTWSARAVLLARSGGPKVARSHRQPVDVLVVSVLAVEHEALMTAAGVTVPGDEEHITYAELGPRKVRFALARLAGHEGFLGVDEAVSLIDQLKPSVIAMCGICAGIRGEVEVGDVIVADAIVHYELRRRDDATDDPRFDSQLVYRLAPRWRTLATASDRLPSGLPGRVHVGAIVTGRTALENPNAQRQMMSMTRKTLGFDLETEAAHLLAARGEWIVAKGVAGFGEGAKDDSARASAALASASWLVTFLSEHASPNQGAERSH